MAATLVVALAGCTQAQLQGWLPGNADTTNHTGDVIGLWVTSWIVLMVVGMITWALTIWAAVVYRRRKGQTGLPVQLRYNLPIEVFYTIVPLILVLGFFAFTARDQAKIETRAEDPDVTVEVYGKQWAWDFNYVDENVYSVGVQASTDPEGPVGNVDYDALPTLYLPVDRTVELVLESRDVQHSFWVVNFLYKKDLYPGVTNYMSFVPQEEGTFTGKCAELCGEYHSQMLFQVKVVSQGEYDAYIESLRDAGFEGDYGQDYDRNSNLPGVNVPGEAEESE
uniref:aa3-type cytochrome oxidase subunit II n=1 Tax=Planctomonas psychrotolerans TaxID=2528712 RepID=UPI00123B39DF|nr:cytochrome c oxidase subunit II [Planctomonas psychrotolerans]